MRHSNFFNEIIVPQKLCFFKAFYFFAVTLFGSFTYFTKIDHNLPTKLDNMSNICYNWWRRTFGIIFGQINNIKGEAYGRSDNSE